MNEKIKDILLRSLREDISIQEQILLQEWADADAGHQVLLDELQHPEIIASFLKKMDGYNADKAWARLQASPRKEENRKKVFILYPVRRIAAAILLLLAGTATFYVINQNKTKPVATSYTGNVMPGRDGAKLRLSNGNIVTIDSLKDGLIARDENMSIFKEAGKIIYKGNGNNNTPTILYNEIIADKGRKTTAVLPDGSTVWVNAGSSVRYPLQFTGDERLVSMTGEASFSVIHDDRKPFRVQVKDQLVEDIGTEFNINAYDDEEVIRTTLIEGTASVTVAGNKVVLTKGKESVNKNGLLRLGNGNVEQAIAWRNGLFSFDHADLTTVLRQFTRWYDVEVRYEGNVPDETFTGEMERGMTLADALDNLKRMHVRFRIEEDKRIVVLP
ncbi:DUF4974 domain-containing protein [Chitinophagaceae bacterium 26-R-25]|nr:DUF4974 domain-containing protein [Chitinophagaceae bacterium 26-R-25]